MQLTKSNQNPHLPHSKTYAFSLTPPCCLLKITTKCPSVNTFKSIIYYLFLSWCIFLSQKSQGLLSPFYKREKSLQLDKHNASYLGLPGRTVYSKVISHISCPCTQPTKRFLSLPNNLFKSPTASFNNVNILRRAYTPRKLSGIIGMSESVEKLLLLM